MSNVVIFGPADSGKTTLLGFLSTAMLRGTAFNDEVYKKLKMIKKICRTDDFRIGDVRNPEFVKEQLILPAFVSLDLDELRKFREEEESMGTTKRLHRKKLIICMSEESTAGSHSDYTNENISCTFVDTPGHRQRLSDKYKGFFEGDIGMAVLCAKDILSLSALDNDDNTIDKKKYSDKWNQLFEPLRIWCDYRSSKKLIIVISKIDQLGDDEEVNRAEVNRAMKCLRQNLSLFTKQAETIPITPISIRIIKEKNSKKNSRMSQFFKRKEINIYSAPDKTLGTGTLIQCLRMVLQQNDNPTERNFSLASVDRLMKATINNSEKTVLQIRSLYGDISKHDVVYLGPIRSRKTGEIAYARCAISSLKADGLDKLDEHAFDKLIQGNVGGVLFSSVKDVDNNQQIRLHFNTKTTDYNILKTTIMYAGEIKKGDIVKVKIFRQEHLLAYSLSEDTIYHEYLPKLMPYDSLFLYWYGKKIKVNVIEMSRELLKGTNGELIENAVCLSLLISPGEREQLLEFALPVDQEGALLHTDNVLIGIPESIFSSVPPQKWQQELYTYVSATICDIKRIAEYDSVTIISNPELDLNYYLADSEIQYHCDCDEYGQQFINVSFLAKDSHLKVNTTMLELGRMIRKTYRRLDYYQWGGFEMNLTCLRE